jgi:hypothetical protein
MTLPRFLVLLGISTILAWVAWVLTLNYIDPGAGDPVSIFLFSASLFLALSGSVALGGFLLRLWRSGGTEFVLYRALATSVRQGFLLGTLAVITLVLQGAHLLRWWNGALLVAGLVLLEALAQVQRRTHAR